MNRALVIIGVLGVLAACKQKEAESSGVGQWRFGRSTLADATGVCQPTDLQDGRKATWCFGNPAYKIGGRVADVDLYFLGTAPTAPLIEVQLKVRGCDETALDTWMRATYGPSSGGKGAAVYWQNAFLWAAAIMPSEPGRCLVHFLPITEAAEIARIKGV